MAVAHRLGAGGEQASHARLYTVGPAAGQTCWAIAATESRPTIHHGQHQSLTRKNAIDMSPLDLGLLSPVISSPCAARKAIRRLVSKHSHGLSYHSNHHAHRDAHAWLLR